jgi:hypothetical protein
VTSIAAGGTSTGDELLAPEGHAAVTAVPGLDAYFRFINEHYLFPVYRKRSWSIAILELAQGSADSR